MQKGQILIMHIAIAKFAGFCMGVRRAINLTITEARKKSKVYTYGPLIHNPQVINILKERNIDSVKELDEITEENSTVVIRAHGITPKEEDRLKTKAKNICNATCPHVIRVQRLVHKYSQEDYLPLILGDKGHAEVVGILGFSHDKGIIIENHNDIKGLPDNLGKVCIVAQTTLSQKFFEEAVEAIKPKASECEIFNTICSATEKRQTELIKMAEKHEAIIVVGGRTSANTTRLYEISKKINPNTFFAETEDELDKETLKNFKSIGITAGASTPNWLIKKIFHKLKEIDRDNQNLFMKFLNKTADIIFKSNVSLSLGAAGLTFISCNLQHITQAPIVFVLISFCYCLSMHTLNNFRPQDIESTLTTDDNKNKNKPQKRFIAIATVSAVLANGLSLYLNTTSFILMIIFTIGGIMYNVNILPNNKFNNIPYKKIKDIPGSKDIFTTLGWLTVIVLFPVITEKEHAFTLYSVFLCLFIGISVFSRTVLLDIKDMQNDLLIGKETLPVLLGEKKSKKIVYFSISCAVLLTAVCLFLAYSTYLLPLLLLCVNFIIYIILYNKKIFSDELGYDVFMNINFLSCGIFTFLIWVLT